MKKVKPFISLFLAIFMVVSLAACSSSQSSEGTQAEDSGSQTTESQDTVEASGAQATGQETTSYGNFTVQVGPNPETLDPTINASNDGLNMFIMAFETLLIVDENGDLVPGQAESYTVSDDGLTYTFTMRDGLKWSDGSDLDAKDFEYTLKRMASPTTAAPFAETIVGMIDGYQDAIGNPDEEGNTTTEPDWDALNVTASEDGKTLTIVLSYPCSYFDRLCGFAGMSPVQQATIEANGDSWAVDPATYVCNGPYMITEWIPSERIVMSKNPYYNGGWDKDRIVSESITFLLLEDSTAAYAAFNSGEAQLISEVPTDEIPSLTKVEDGGNFHVQTIMGTYYINIQTQREPFTDPNVRKALSLSIDREYIANTIMQGTYSPAYNFVGPGISDYEGDFYDNANGGEHYISDDLEANIEEAKQLLADAGYPDGEGFPVITYSTNDSSYHLPVAEYLQQAWAELGITLNIERVEWSAFLPLRRAGEYDMCRAGWTLDYDDPSNILDLFYSTNGNNDGKYNNPEYDAAIDASKVADKAAHFEALHEAEDIMMEDAACIPVAYYNVFWLQDESLKEVWNNSAYYYLMYGYVEE